jgi:hypothetical protein
MKDRGLSSPDDGDGLALTFAVPAYPSFEDDSAFDELRRIRALGSGGVLMDHQSQLIADVASGPLASVPPARRLVAEAEAEKASDELRHAWSKLRCWQDEQVEAARSNRRRSR